MYENKSPRQDRQESYKKKFLLLYTGKFQQLLYNFYRLLSRYLSAIQRYDVPLILHLLSGPFAAISFDYYDTFNGSHIGA